ncbi:hypothetical protein FUAX_47790 (plasmid) [Fulvitalea axinellae]|uniref:Uncharacterized protein n=1 Tax=Fulvitalea axinellae TaxID=1182444 RepID=A0AAU9CZG5_9BACT|nr:hypothetical protein FUAX_47790 [Fulvitalea axinellae]
MKSFKKKQDELLEKFLSGETSRAEEESLNRNGSGDSSLDQALAFFEETQRIEDPKAESIAIKAIETAKSKRPVIHWTWVSATVAASLVIAFSVFYPKEQPELSGMDPMLVKALEKHGETVLYQDDEFQIVIR